MTSMPMMRAVCSVHTTNVIISHSSERIFKKYMADKHILKNITIENIESDKKMCSLLTHVPDLSGDFISLKISRPFMLRHSI